MDFWRGRAQCLEGLRAMAPAIERIEAVRQVAEGDDVITWYDMTRTGGHVVPTVNRSHLRGGRIDRVRVLFDTAPLR
ncbi:nuclear transport factor 2-like protein [Kineococcus indalonis]|uniref:hypothetical protein n=1 Tax=Kineococcus indalonis TaxID=2696566 RepID=UPI001411B575|nr:hypothetical protein [Kineococcus indalonis]NAZ87516.1 hypothetical protein [Kineococcus indalonis]